MLIKDKLNLILKHPTFPLLIDRHICVSVLLSRRQNARLTLSHEIKGYQRSHQYSHQDADDRSHKPPARRVAELRDVRRSKPTAPATLETSVGPVCGQHLGQLLTEPSGPRPVNWTTTLRTHTYQICLKLRSFQKQNAPAFSAEASILIISSLSDAVTAPLGSKEGYCLPRRPPLRSQ